MKEYRTIDIGRINCWIVNLKPYGQGDSDEVIKDFQQRCINYKSGVFGIGWLDTNKAPKEGRHYLSESDASWFSAGVSNKAKNNMEKVQKGDLVIMRLRDGHIYIGKVKKQAFYESGLKDKNQSERLSCMCEVEKWHKIENQDELPQAICGRLSQRQQQTIELIANSEIKLLMIFVYEHLDGTEKIVDVPKVRLTKANFTRALNYMELEDLVCAYIYDKHKKENYMLLPSSCKVSRMKYEFNFVCSNRKPITCQVKNQNADAIKISDYKNDIDVYEKIYLFSGNGNIQGCPNGNIEIIDKQDLYNKLINTEDKSIEFMRTNLERYYDFSDDDIDDKTKKIIAVLKDNGYEEKKKHSKNKKWFKEWFDEGKQEITDVEVDGGYFSAKYDCFIIWDKNKFDKARKVLGI
ncbi:MAG: hypothetical protein K5768_05070 [Firmicutes bacterium]|nr:hypothetical protein [Bacillota bacterium]